MCVCVCVYVSVCMCVCVYGGAIPRGMCVYACMCLCVYVCMSRGMCVYACMCLCVYVCMMVQYQEVCVCMCVCVCVCVCLCVWWCDIKRFVCVCVYIYMCAYIRVYLNVYACINRSISNCRNVEKRFFRKISCKCAEKLAVDNSENHFLSDFV